MATTSILKELEELKNQPLVIHSNPFEKFPQALIFLLVGVSGVGKSTAVRAIVRTTIAGKVIAFVVTYATRNPRHNKETGMEAHGVNYFFISTEEFVRLKALGYFAEWEEVYTDRFYGTSFNQLHQIASEYGYGITDIDIHGARALKDLFPNNIHTIFLRPQSPEQAIQQLRTRAESENISEVEILTRIARFEKEMAAAQNCDSQVTSIAGEPEHAVKCIRQIMEDRINEKLEEVI